MQTNPTPHRRPSLIERAADAYHLAALLNRRVEHDLLELDAAAIIPPPTAASRPPAHIDCDELAMAGFVVPEGAPAGLAEEFRIVKRQLLASALGSADAAPVRHGRAILVSSAEPDEGKTFCAVNLALSLAREKDVEVLLVDADFAKPEILSTLGIAGGPGLIDALCDGVPVEDCIIRTDFANLSVLPAGRAINDTNEVLASERMRALFEQLTANDRRIILFDSSPALAASTASVLATLAGQVVMVVRADVTGEHALREAIGLLGGCDHLRLLLNAVQLAPHGRRFSHYYGYGGS